MPPIPPLVLPELILREHNISIPIIIFRVGHPHLGSLLHNRGLLGRVRPIFGRVLLLMILKPGVGFPLLLGQALDLRFKALSVLDWMGCELTSFDLRQIIDLVELVAGHALRDDAALSGFILAFSDRQVVTILDGDLLMFIGICVVHDFLTLAGGGEGV